MNVLVCVCGRVCVYVHVRMRGMCVGAYMCVGICTWVCVCTHMRVCACVLAIVMITPCIVNRPTPTVQSSSECDCSVKSLTLEW